MKFTPLASASAFLGRTRRQQYEQIPENENETENETENEENRQAEDAENRSLLHTKLWTLQLKNNRGIVTVFSTAIGILIGGWVASL